MITTSVMIKMGRVKGNKMVNMQLSNAKLVDRGTRMIVEELGLPYDEANRMLRMHGSVKKPSTHTSSTKTVFKSCVVYSLSSV